MKGSKRLRYRTGGLGVPAMQNGEAEVDAVRLAGDVAAFEAATGFPHDPFAIGLFVLVGGIVREIVSGARRLGGALGHR